MKEGKRRSKETLIVKTDEAGKRQVKCTVGKIGLLREWREKETFIGCKKRQKERKKKRGRGG